MFLIPIINSCLRPSSHLLKQVRTIRPSLKISKEKFELTLDVRNFSRDEIRVKARPEYVVIEGKQEKKSKTGLVVRQFVRKFKLPNGCTPSKMHSSLSPDGILTIKANRQICEQNFPCETLIPISFTEPKKDEVTIIQVTPIESKGCDYMLKGKPGDKPKPKN